MFCESRPKDGRFTLDTSIKGDLYEQSAGLQKAAMGQLWLNLAANYGASTLQSLANLVIIGLAVRTIGSEAFSVYVAVVAFIAYAGLLELGLGQLVSRWVAHYAPQGQHAQLTDRLSTIWHLYLVLAAFLLVVSPFLMFLVSRIITIPWDAIPYARPAFFLVIVDLALRFPLAFFTGILLGCQRADLLSLARALSVAVRLALTGSFLWLGWGIMGLALAAGLGSATCLVPSIKIACRVYPHLRLRLGRGLGGHLRECLSYALYASLIRLGTQLVFQTDILVIGWAIGVGAITPYFVVQQVFLFLLSALAQGSTVIFARYPYLESVSGTQTVNSSYLFVTKMYTALGFLGAGLMLVLAPLMGFWVGPDVPVETSVVGVFAVLLVVHAPVHTASLWLLSAAKHRTNAITSIIEGVLNLGLSIALVKLLGVFGVALATLIAQLLTNAVYLPWYASKMLSLPFFAYLRSAVLCPLAWLLPTLGWIPVALHLAAPYSSFTLVSAGAVFTMLWSVMMWLAVLASEDRREVCETIRQLRDRTAPLVKWK